MSIGVMVMVRLDVSTIEEAYAAIQQIMGGPAGVGPERPTAHPALMHYEIEDML